ncbi:MAG: hypothetical protein Q9212_002409 [Teloschistes hypoglaucus]
MPITMPPPPNKEDLVATWSFLETGVERIMRNLKEGVDMGTYMGIYTAVHNFCTSQKGVTGTGNVIGQQSHRGAHLLGEDLYKNLREYLSRHLKEILEQSKGHEDEALLSFYIREWNRYTTAAKYTNHLFRYLNRHWVKREIDEGKKDIYDVYTLHLVQWREVLFKDITGKVMAAVLKMVEKQRNGETIEQAQIKSIVDSFVSLGLDETDSTKSTLNVYRFHFEKPFLAATKSYYEKESSQFVAENSVVEYMKKADTRLEEEKERVGLYLHPDIMTPLMRNCLEVLVTAHSSLLRDEFQVLLDNDRQDDLARMYRLLNRIVDGLDPLRSRFESHVRKCGLASVDKIAGGADKDMDPKTYVDALLEVHSQYQKLVDDAFNGESEFVRSLDNACKEFVNRNGICKSGSTRSPELLAKYADTLLKKNAKSTEEADLEASLVQIMTIFKYIEDKDVFQKFYSRMLAKRLVHFSSASEDAETSMISKLKEACGYEYTNKLQRMFQDIQISKDLNTSYKDWQSKALDDDDLKKAVDPHYQILGTGFWPLVPPNTTFSAPPEIVKTYKRFESFYFDKHSGRKLTWLWQLCKGELKANYVKNTKIPYTFQVSTYQMAILLLFNDQEELSYEAMMSATMLNTEQFDPSIAVLVKHKILNMSPENGKPESGSNFTLNYNFKSKKVKVNLNIGIRSESKQEVEDTHKTIEEDRKLLMQSAIVRIMKSRKKMKHVQLVQETISQIKSRFSPKIPDIKKSIDQLIEKEYLERLEGEELGLLSVTNLITQTKPSFFNFSSAIQFGRDWHQVRAHADFNLRETTVSYDMKLGGNIRRLMKEDAQKAQAEFDKDETAAVTDNNIKPVDERNPSTQADASFATLNNSGSESLVQSGFEPDIIIVDEVGQSSIPSLCVPLTSFGTWKVLMVVGDWKQLQPTVLSKTWNEVVGNSVISPLEQMDHVKASIFQLKTQYRMSAAIAQWPGKNFYEDKLVTHPSVRVTNPIRDLVRQVSSKVYKINGTQGSEYFYFDVPNSESHGEQSGGHSLLNYGNASAAKYWLGNHLSLWVLGDSANTTAFLQDWHRINVASIRARSVFSSNCRFLVQAPQINVSKLTRLAPFAPLASQGCKREGWSIKRRRFSTCIPRRWELGIWLFKSACFWARWSSSLIGVDGMVLDQTRKVHLIRRRPDFMWTKGFWQEVVDVVVPESRDQQADDGMQIIPIPHGIEIVELLRRDMRVQDLLLGLSTAWSDEIGRSLLTSARPPATCSTALVSREKMRAFDSPRLADDLLIRHSIWPYVSN